MDFACTSEYCTVHIGQVSGLRRPTLAAARIVALPHYNTPVGCKLPLTDMQSVRTASPYGSAEPKRMGLSLIRNGPLFPLSWQPGSPPVA